MLENMSKAVRNVLIVMIFVLIAGVLGRVSAQSPFPGTNFTISCLSSDPARIYFLVESDSVEHYKLSMFGTPPFSTSIPSEFDTSPGKYVLGWVNNSSGNIQEVHFTNEQGFDAVMTIRYDYMSFCDHNDETPLPTQEPESTPEPTYEAPVCKASAIDQGTGRAYCYDPETQPHNLSGVVVPVPPAP